MKSETAAEATVYPVWKVLHAVEFAVKLHIAKGAWILVYKKGFEKALSPVTVQSSLAVLACKALEQDLHDDLRSDKKIEFKAWQMTQNHQPETQSLYQSYFM